jgi:hypothetical protein
MRKGRIGAIVMCGLVLASARAPGTAQEDRGEIRGLRLGLHAPAMTTDGFGEFACGSNGGPPRLKLDDWTGFTKCRPEANGLREVYVRFDDEAEYVSKAIDDPLYAGPRTGTRVAGHAVILSVLFDEGGVLRGIRMVTDPRAGLVERRMARLLKLVVFNRYGPDGWQCTDSPPAEGETPVAGIFLKQRCEKLSQGRFLSVDVRFLRKPGQSAVDPSTGEDTEGQFESWSRFEIFDPAYRRP